MAQPKDQGIHIRDQGTQIRNQGTQLITSHVLIIFFCLPSNLLLSLEYFVYFWTGCWLVRPAFAEILKCLIKMHSIWANLRPIPLVTSSSGVYDMRHLKCCEPMQQVCSQTHIFFWYSHIDFKAETVGLSFIRRLQSTWIELFWC